MSDLVTIKTFLYRHEAELARNLLVEEGIEAVVTADDFGGHSLRLTCGVQLLVKKGDAERAKRILEVLEKPIEE